MPTRYPNGFISILILNIETKGILLICTNRLIALQYVRNNVRSEKKERRRNSDWKGRSKTMIIPLGFLVLKKKKKKN